MKSLLVFLAILLSGITAKTQQPDSLARATQYARVQQANQYLQEASKAKKSAKTMAFCGGTLTGVGALMMTIALTSAITSLAGESSITNSERTANIGGVLILAGAATTLGSIPISINARKKRRAAEALMYSNYGVSLAPGSVMPGTRSAGVSLVISLGK